MRSATCCVTCKVDSMTAAKDKRITPWQAFLAGGIAGVSARTLTSPLDVVKILAQVGTKDSRQGFVATFKNVYANEGLRAFWKGNWAACVRLFPYSAVQFTTYTQCKIWLTGERGRITPLNALLAGSIGGVAATVATYPFDMIKTRLTTQHVAPSKRVYKGLWHAFPTIVREEGIFALYKGISATLLGVIPFAGATFMCYEVLDRAWGKPKWQMTPVENFINGCAAAAFAQTLSFPFDTIRKKLQAQHNAKAMRHKVISGDVEFTGMWDAFRQTHAKHGVVGLWRGTTANLLKVMPYSGIMFATFEAVKRMYLYSNGYTESPWRDRPRPGVNQALTPDQLKQALERRDLKQS